MHFGGRAHTNHWDSGQWCTSCPQNHYGMLKQSNKHVFVSSLHSQSESGQSLDLDISRSGRHLNFPQPPPLVRRGWGGRWWWRPLFWASPNGYWDISKAQHRTPTELWDRALQSGPAKCIEKVKKKCLTGVLNLAWGLIYALKCMFSLRKSTLPSAKMLFFVPAQRTNFIS